MKFDGDLVNNWVNNRA